MIKPYPQYEIVASSLLTIAYVYKSPREELDTRLVQKALTNKFVLVGDINLEKETSKNETAKKEIEGFGLI